MPATLVVDCSVAAKWLLPEPNREAAMHLLEQQASGEVLLIAPDLLLAEFASLLSKRNRRKQISAERAREAFQLMHQCAPKLFSTRLLLNHALTIAVQYKLSLWDCVYIALAVEHDCVLITSDRRLFRAGSGRHASMTLLD